jgi:hypothetical protein
MLSIDECRRLLGQPAMSDEQVVAIRDDLYAFAHALVDDYVRQRGHRSPKPE